MSEKSLNGSGNPVADASRPKKIENGGPAFPSIGNVAHNSDWLTEEGMHLRDYFAAHAPINHLWHFEVRMPNARPEADWSGVEESGPDSMPANWRDQSAWDQEKKRQAFVQWPWVWADAMLLARNARGEQREPQQDPSTSNPTLEG